MNLMALLQSALYVISEALLYPVMAILIALFGVIIFRMGEILAEGLKRRSVNIPEPAEAAAFLSTGADLSALSPAVRRFLQSIQNLPASVSAEIQIAYRLQEREEALNWELARHRRLVRISPMLGLMGTLIPMGQALAALAEGEMDKMANALIIAFTTTVVGLFIAGVAYVLSQYKARWTSQDRRTMELFAELAAAGKPGGR
ncbi:MotA/TolQ/ExbB proton channel family protein [bacterium]|nr:MotA/TolQ/ExbB proton channel family protein [bacterium]